MTKLIPIGVGRGSGDLITGLRQFIKKCRRQNRREGLEHVRTAVTVDMRGRSVFELYHAVRFARARGFDVWFETPDGKLIDSKTEGY